MATIMQLDIKFAGSFQARLAVGLDAGASSPTDPFGTYGVKSGGMGAMLAYKEKPFDRIIRLSKPVDLRNLQLSPWRDTVVRSVNMTVGGVYQPASPGNTLLGRLVSLGPKAIFIEDEGYELFDATLMIDPFLVGRPTNRMDGYGVTNVASRKEDYQKAKLARFAAPDGPVDPIRVQVIGFNMTAQFDGWATIHTNTTPYYLELDPGTLVFTADFGASKTMDKLSNYIWIATLVFSHWDADCLCGRLEGVIDVVHKSVVQRIGAGVMSVVGKLPGMGLLTPGRKAK